MRRLGSHRIARVSVPGAAIVSLGLVAGALAYFGPTGSGSGSATVGSLNAPTITGATPGAGTVAVSWSTVTPPGSGTVSYYVQRDGGSPGGSCPTSSLPTTVTNCTDSGLTAGTHHYTVTAVRHTWTATSIQTSVTLTSGAASQLSFTAQPSSGQNIQATGTGGFSVAVAVQDANGNTVTTNSSTSVTLAVGTNPSSGVLSCSTGLTKTASSGVASFSGCAITKSGTGYTLTATSSPSYTSPSNANSFNITAGAASKLSFTAQPSSGQNIQATGTGSFSIAVAVGVAAPTQARPIAAAVAAAAAVARAGTRARVPTRFRG